MTMASSTGGQVKKIISVILIDEIWILDLGLQLKKNLNSYVYFHGQSLLLFLEQTIEKFMSGELQLIPLKYLWYIYKKL